MAVTGYLKGDDKKKELELASLLPEGARRLMGRDEKGEERESVLPGVLAMNKDGGAVQSGLCLTIPYIFLNGKLVFS